MSFSQAGSEISGYIITTKGIRMDLEKVSCVLGWETPKNVIDVQCFLGFANFYRRFIKDYSKVATPLTRMTKKEGGKYLPFVWGPEQQAAIDLLKKVFTSAPTSGKKIFTLGALPRT